MIEFFSECFHCDKPLADIPHDDEWWQGYCGADCARANLPAGGRITQMLHVSEKLLEAKVLALIEQLGDDVDFDVIAAKAGCTTHQAYKIYLATLW